MLGARSIRLGTRQLCQNFTFEIFYTNILYDRKGKFSSQSMEYKICYFDSSYPAALPRDVHMDRIQIRNLYTVLPG